MPRVFLTSANRIAMPRVCVCCGTSTDNTAEEFGDHAAAKSSQRRALRFPICPPCFAHAAHAAGVAPGPPPPRSPSCEASLCPADYVSWKGAERVLDFDSPRFARLFVEANEADRKRVHCDFAWVPPATLRGPVGAGVLLVFGAPNPPPTSFAGSSIFTPTVGPAFPPLPPPRRALDVSTGMGVFLVLVLVLVGGVCVLGTQPPAQPPPPAAAPAFQPGPTTPTPEPSRRARRRHRSEPEAPTPTTAKPQ